MVGLNSPVTVRATGEVTTIAKLAEAGRIRFSYVEHYGNYDTPAYFADVTPDSGWRISKQTYERGIAKYGRESLLAPEPEPEAPYTFEEWQAALKQRIAHLPAYQWLLDYDFQDWRRDIPAFIALDDSALVAQAEQWLREAE